MSGKRVNVSYDGLADDTWMAVCDGSDDECSELLWGVYASAAEAGDAARKHLREHHAERMTAGRFLARQYCKAFIWGS